MNLSSHSSLSTGPSAASSELLSPSASVAVDVRNLKKSYGSLEALKGVSFTIPHGGVFCILGPNGAGKTTLIKILTTISRADSGEAFIDGCNVQTDLIQVKSRIGVVAQENQFDDYLTLWHNLTMHAQMHGIKRAEFEPRITDLLHMMQLWDRRFEHPDVLSGGMKRRIALIRALIHSPKVLFLDEPTTGLDPEVRKMLWQLINLVKSTTTVILTTHYMEEAEQLSDQILFLSHGQVIAQDTPSEFKRRCFPHQPIEVVFRHNTSKAVQADLVSMVRQQGGSVLSETHEHTMFETPSNNVLRFWPQERWNSAWLWRQLDPNDVIQFGPVESTLEDVYLRMTGADTVSMEV